ncbi:MAG TPA: hypothetical protein VHM25_12615 [Polyangiaceae bacterium]|jgi:riboflavin biosynthesis pyrimidine reductase|nr:hypothetical protein [Polyangiaceae bacterium]
MAQESVAAEDLTDPSRRLIEALGAVPPALHAAVIVSIREVLTRNESATRRLDKSLNEANTHYVVHDGDLKLLEAVATLGVSILPLFKPLTALPALIALLFRYRRKRARIDGEQAAVLLCLRAAPPGGYTSAELSAALPLRESLSEDRVLQVLASLKSVLLEDGGRSDFVAESAGIWTAVDV